MASKRKSDSAAPRAKAARRGAGPREKLLLAAGGATRPARAIVGKWLKQVDCSWDEKYQLFYAVIRALEQQTPAAVAQNALCIDVFMDELSALEHLEYLPRRDGRTALMEAAAARNGHAVWRLTAFGTVARGNQMTADGRRAVDFLPALPEQPGLHAMIRNNLGIVLASFPDDILRLIMPYAVSHLAALGELGPRFARLAREVSLQCHDDMAQPGKAMACYNAQFPSAKCRLTGPITVAKLRFVPEFGPDILAAYAVYYGGFLPSRLLFCSGRSLIPGPLVDWVVDVATKYRLVWLMKDMIGARNDILWQLLRGDWIDPEFLPGLFVRLKQAGIGADGILCEKVSPKWRAILFSGDFPPNMGIVSWEIFFEALARLSDPSPYLRWAQRWMRFGSFLGVLESTFSVDDPRVADWVVDGKFVEEECD